ncbi:MAG: pre-peptidase C-terminal domain-containing protein, partial [Phototrophicaceae bacterium]
MLVGKVPRELDRDKAFHYIPQNLVPVIYMATRSARENRYATIEAFWRAFDQAARQPTQPPLIDPLTLTGRRPQPSYTQVPAGDSIPKRPENFVGGNAGQQQNRVPLLSGTRSTLRAGDNVGLRWMGGMVIVLALVGILGLGGWVYQENFNSANAATREVLQVASSSTAQAQTLAAVPTRTTIPTSSPTRRPTVVPTRRPSATPARPNNLNYRGALLQEGESDPYNIPLTRGETITVQMNADNDSFDTYLYLYNSRGLLIAADDDSGSGLNSVLTYTVTATGDYQILASSYDGDGLGSYELLIEINR